jgi:predicted metal-binding protein
MEKYRDMALEMGAVNARLITPEDLFFDKRVILKCRWGCDFNGVAESPKCGRRGIGYEDGVEMIRAYRNILLVHNHDAHRLTKILLAVERRAFLDGLYLAFTLRACYFCKECSTTEERGCIAPAKVRPCDQAFGLDVYKTATTLGLPCYPLQSKDEQQNRYGFALLD